MNPVRDIKYYALDLELNQLQTPKIIQVGIAIGSPIRPNNIQTYSWYLDPEEEITPFIENLTGISNQLIKEKAVTHKTLAQELGELLNSHQCFVNPVCWGGSDASELKNEFKQKNIHFPFFGRRIIDVKTIYVFLEIINGRSPAGGLRKSMNRYKIPFNGIPHRAEVDAENTLRFFFHLMSRQRDLETSMNILKSVAY